MKAQEFFADNGRRAMIIDADIVAVEANPTAGAGLPDGLARVHLRGGSHLDLIDTYEMVFRWWLAARGAKRENG